MNDESKQRESQRDKEDFKAGLAQKVLKAREFRKKLRLDKRKDDGIKGTV